MTRFILTLAMALFCALPAQADTSVVRLLKTEADGLKGLSKSRVEWLMKGHAGTRVSYTDDFLSGLPKARGGQEWKCLAEALYFEARGETVKGQFAVAEVILNRVDSARFPDTVCGVVNQGTGRKHACQFSYTCDGRAETIAEPKAYERVAKVAKLMLAGAPRQLTDGATYYHTSGVKPKWSRKFARTTTIGVHQFYRPGQKLASN